jgi:plastocyanin
MKSYLLASLTVLLACCYVGTVFAADSEAGEMEMLVFPEKYKAMAVNNGGTINGVVKFEGDVPEKKALEITKDQKVCGVEEKFDESLVVGEGNALKNTIVYLIDISEGKDFDKEAKLEIDQKGCKFTPHVQIVPVGARLTMLNFDKIMHNVHIFSDINKSVNKPQAKSRRKMPLKAVKKVEGPVSVKCDVHGWMSAWISYVPHPYFAVTNEKGEFTLEDVPAGEYKLGYWHETCGTNNKAPVAVTVEAGGTVAQDFTLKLK